MMRTCGGCVRHCPTPGEKCAASAIVPSPSRQFQTGITMHTCGGCVRHCPALSEKCCVCICICRFCLQDLKHRQWCAPTKKKRMQCSSLTFRLVQRPLHPAFLLHGSSKHGQRCAFYSFTGKVEGAVPRPDEVRRSRARRYRFPVASSHPSPKGFAAKHKTGHECAAWQAGSAPESRRNPRAHVDIQTALLQSFMQASCRLSLLNGVTSLSGFHRGCATNGRKALWRAMRLRPSPALAKKQKERQ